MVESQGATKLIDGRVIAKTIREELATEVAAHVASGARAPGLAVVLVGDDPASHVYVNMKEKAAREVGIASYAHRLAASTSQEALESLVETLNRDPAVDGILVQLPLPKHLNTERVLHRVDPRKDVDGLHPDNLGLLVAGRPGLRPCTPRGCMELLARAGVELRGARALVIGRSNLVGKPLSLLLLERSATVTVAHSNTRDLAEEVARADVVLAAVGRAGLVRGAWLKEGAVVIDVGVNRLEDGRLVGDVAFDEALGRASAITPVPGGVGPMTIAMLLANTLLAHKAPS